MRHDHMHLQHHHGMQGRSKLRTALFPPFLDDVLGEWLSLPLLQRVHRMLHQQFLTRLFLCPALLHTGRLLLHGAAALALAAALHGHFGLRG